MPAPTSFFARYRAQVVFWTVLGFGFLSSVLLLLGGPWFAVLVGVSLGLTVWALMVNDRRGFVRTRQMRRAHEPARHFNGAQVLILFVLMMIQVGLIAYDLLTMSAA